MYAVRAQAGAELGNASVNGLLFDRDQVLWIDTAVTGLHRLRDWQADPARFERISERHGIVGPPFGVNLLQDARGRIWTQLHVYDPAKDSLYQLTPVDGVNIGTPWFNAYARLRSGRFLFGGSKGLLAVDPEGFDPSHFAPPLVVSDVQVNGRVRRVGQLSEGLTLTPQDRSFSVEFAALDYSDPLRLRYVYRLQGFDPDWLSARPDRRAASYSNLAPGDYVLRVRATNRSGAWSPHELAIPVRVAPAWWQHWWFRTLVLGLCVALVVAVVQWRTRHLRWRQAELQAKVRERTAELESLTERLRTESAALQEASLTDPLTGLRNRRFLMRHVDVDVAVSMRRYEDQRQRGLPAPDDADLLFFMVDIDYFKEVNDRFGHAAGDAVLMQMRSRLEQVFRDADYMVRWGGEEFLMVARWISRERATDLAERARRAVAEQPFTLDDGQRIDCTCSLGFACFPIAPRFPHLLDWSETVSLADAALLLAKGRGRNGWVGVRDAGALDEAQLRARPAPAQWIADGAITVQTS
jgi:diguanylate cyclase (GGDEF)-like protein